MQSRALEEVCLPGFKARAHPFLQGQPGCGAAWAGGCQVCAWTSKQRSLPLPSSLRLCGGGHTAHSVLERAKLHLWRASLPSSISPSCRVPRRLSLQTTAFAPGRCLRFHTWAHRQIHLVGFSDAFASCLVPQECFQRFWGSLEIWFFKSVLEDPGNKPGCKMHVPSQTPQMHILLGCCPLVKCFPETLPGNPPFLEICDHSDIARN